MFLLDPGNFEAQIGIGRGMETRPHLDETPVVLVHGYGGRKSQWFQVERALRDAGFTSVHAMTYNAFTTDIPTLAEQLATMVRTIVSETGARHVHLVGHSLGGVIIRYAVSVLGLDPLVATAITIASPHGGSPIARFGFGATAAQLRPGSHVLRAIESAARPGRTRWFAFYGDLDVVVPGSRAKIRPTALRAVNIAVKGQSHLTIVMSPRVARTIVDQLTQRDALRSIAA